MGSEMLIRDRVCIGRGVCALRSKSTISTSYIYHALNHFNYKWRNIEQGSTFSAINGDDIKSFTIPLVDNVEHACTFLSRVDELISNSIKMYSCLLMQKKDLLSQIFI